MSDLSFSTSASASAGLSGASASASVGIEAFGMDLGDIGVSIDTNLKIIEMLMPINFVSFDFNPKSFKVTQKQKTAKMMQAAKKSAGTSPTGTPAGAFSQYLGAPPRTITFTALLSEEGSGLLNALADMTAIGGGLKARCDMMMNWCIGGPSTIFSALVGGAMTAAAAVMGIGLQQTNHPPMLILQWGDPMRGFFVFGRMSNVAVDYKRFDTIGNPIRAEVACTFEEAAPDLISLLTNPTSGGEPGRRLHTMTQGDNLQNVATERYGRPGAWRDVAEANGIDDPMRVRPGRVLSMPPPQDIGR